MNVLYLAHRIPYPPNKGDKLRAFRQIEHLSRRHRVWCACFVDTPADRQYVQPLEDYCERVGAIPLARRTAAVRGLAGLARGSTVTQSFYRSAAMTETLDAWTRDTRFDTVVAFSSSMAPYALQVPTARRVLDLCDLDSLKWADYADFSLPPLKWLYHAEAERLAKLERRWIDAFDATLLITDAEAAGLNGMRANVHIVGNGVHLPALPARPGAPAPPTVGFVGVMDYRPNVDAVEWFVSHCWSGIRDSSPNAQFRIVGRQPAARVRKLAATPGVHVVGEVDDVAAELTRFDVSVAPMRIARGLQNKVLEAMAAARPVVLTSTAAEGIGGQDGRDFLVADDADAVTAHVTRLLANAAQRKRIGQAARRFVDRYHQWDDQLRKFDLIVTASSEPRTQPRESLDAGLSDGARVPRANIPACP